MDTNEVLNQFKETIQFLKEDATRKQAQYEETLRLLREESAKKDATNVKLLMEISDLKKQLAKLIEINSEKGNSSEDEKSQNNEEKTTENETIPDSDSQMDADLGFERPKNRREKRKMMFNLSSDEESDSKRSAQNQDKQGKSCYLSDFPLLSPSKVKTTTPVSSPAAELPATQTPAATPAAEPPRSQKTPATRSARIPPIVIRDKKRYNAITSAFNERKLNYGRGVTVPEGIRIHPPTFNDFREITRFLDNKKEPYHTYALEEEKLNRILIRGINEGATIEEVTNDLNRLGHFPKRVIRWFHKSGDPMAIVLALMPKDDKKIFSLNYLCNVGVKVETQRNQGRSTQCFNCQLHGHSALRCRAPPKCVKCGQGHQSSTCTKTREDPATCANCGGPHPSSYGGCPKNPKHQKSNASPKSQFTWGKQDNSKLAASTSQEPIVTQQVTTFNAALQQLFKQLAQIQSQYPAVLNLVNLPNP